MLSPKLNKDDTSAGTLVFFAGMILLPIVAVVVGFLVYTETSKMNAPVDDAGWMIFQLGFEHQRLLLAAETQQSNDEIKLRGDIYLSRVIIIRDVPALAGVREGMLGDRLSELFQSAHQTDKLLGRLDTPGGRNALLMQLRSDSKMLRELMTQMSKLNQQVQSEKRRQYTLKLLHYLATLELLLLALFGSGVIVYRATNKLRDANYDLEMQYTRQTAILRSIDSAIVGLGSEGTVLYSNPSALVLLGPSAIPGSKLLPSEPGENALLGHIRALLGEPWEENPDRAYAFREVKTEHHGSARTYMIRKFRSVERAQPERQENDTSLIVTITDITLEEEAAIRRDDYDRRLAEASRLLAYAAVSGGIVHEISQPLAAIANYVYTLKSALKRDPGSGPAITIADELGVEVARAMEVVRNVRRMGPQDTHEGGGACDIHEAINHSVRLVLLGRDPPPPITIVEPGEKIMIRGSLPLIGQVVVNLLKNALSASEDAGRRGANVTVTVAGEFAEVRVEDFGSGVAGDAAKTLFAPFSKSSRGGMGLGLAICQRIAGTIGGSLSWENRSGGGAVFCFSVPLAAEGDQT